MYKLKVPIEKITFEQWEMMLETLSGYGDLTYKILKNDEEPLEDWYGVSILHLIYLITTSPHYNIDDEYVLEDGVDNILISGDEKSILEALSPRFNEAISYFIDHLNNDDFILSHVLKNVFGEEDE